MARASDRERGSHDFKMPTAGAVGVELKQIPQLVRNLKHFGKAAVVADKQWIRKLIEIEGVLFPGSTVKAFDTSDAVTAEAWLHHQLNTKTSGGTTPPWSSRALEHLAGEASGCLSPQGEFPLAPPDAKRAGDRWERSEHRLRNGVPFFGLPFLGMQER